MATRLGPISSIGHAGARSDLLATTTRRPLDVASSNARSSASSDRDRMGRQPLERCPRRRGRRPRVRCLRLRSDRPRRRGRRRCRRALRGGRRYRTFGQQVSRRSGYLGDDRATLAGERVEQARLASIRPADDGDLQSFADQRPREALPTSIARLPLTRAISRAASLDSMK